jgi:hypothetical protein
MRAMQHARGLGDPKPVIGNGADAAELHSSSGSVPRCSRGRLPPALLGTAAAAGTKPVMCCVVDCAFAALATRRLSGKAASPFSFAIGSVSMNVRIGVLPSKWVLEHESARSLSMWPALIARFRS